MIFLSDLGIKYDINAKVTNNQNKNSEWFQNHII